MGTIDPHSTEPSVGKCTVRVKHHQLNCLIQLLWTITKKNKKNDDQNRIRRGLRDGRASCLCFLGWRDHAGFDEKEIVHQVVFRPSFRSMIDFNLQEKSYLIVRILDLVWVRTANADLFLCKTFVLSHGLQLTIMQVVGTGVKIESRRIHIGN
jgi:hypothetical protein